MSLRKNDGVKLGEKYKLADISTRSITRLGLFQEEYIRGAVVEIKEVQHSSRELVLVDYVDESIKHANVMSRGGIWVRTHHIISRCLWEAK